MKVYELIETLNNMPPLADVQLVFDCGFAAHDIESIYSYVDDGDLVVALDENNYSRTGVCDGK